MLKAQAEMERFLLSNPQHLQQQLYAHFTHVWTYWQQQQQQPKQHASCILHHMLLHPQFPFYCYKQKSSIQHPHAGYGVFVHSQNVCIPAGTVMCLYPGTVYRPGQNIFLASLGNKFILQRKDGFFVDGNDRYLSKMISRGCTR